MRVSEDDLKAWMIGGLDGSSVSHARLLRALAPVLRAFYRCRVDSGDAIEDLVQETLIAVHTRRASYDRERPFTAWLFAIARYKMIDYFRRAGRFSYVEDFEDSLVADGFEDASNARMDVDRLLDSLSAKQARAIRDTRVKGMSISEAAAEAGIGESDVKISVHRGLKALAARIAGQRR